MIINLVGPRPSGKSVYLATMSCWDKQYKARSNISVNCINDNARKLQDATKYIIFENEQLEPPRVEQDFDDYPVYRFTIFIKKNLFNSVEFNVSARIILGEIFENCSSDNKIDDTLRAIAQETSLLIIDANSYRQDAVYAEKLENYLSKLSEFCQNFINQNGRIAVVLSKCDSLDVWINRHNPDKLFSQRFPKTKQALEQWAGTRGVEAKYFTSSAFGCYGTNNCEPNARIITKSESGISCVLKEPAYWRPYGLISPIYWLYSRGDLNGLDHY